MAHKAANGWIAPFPEGEEYTLVDDTGDTEIIRRATGIFVGPNGLGDVRLNYGSARLPPAGWPRPA